jgi:hypothetical protein
MKRIFKTDQALKVVTRNSKTNKTIELIYAITDTDIADRWINLININNQRNNNLRYNYRKFLSQEEILEKFKLFRDNIIYINAHYDRVLTDIVSIDFLKDNQNILNDLHEEYEIYGDRLEHMIATGYFNNPKASEFYNEVWPGDSHDKVTHEAFLLLNEQIHNFEAIFRNWNTDYALCTCLYDFMPNKPAAEVLPEDYLHEELKPEDYILFSPEHKWGWAYLGYNTLGKHWSSTCNDNDIEVVKRNAVRPQHRFAAETYLNFSTSADDYDTRIRLYNWWLENNFSEFVNPRMRLEDLALGFIPVAKLYQFTIDSVTTVINDKIDKHTWNKDIWSSTDTIEQVEIIKI